MRLPWPQKSLPHSRRDPLRNRPRRATTLPDLYLPELNPPHLKRRPPSHHVRPRTVTALERCHPVLMPSPWRSRTTCSLNLQSQVRIPRAPRNRFRSRRPRARLRPMRSHPETRRHPVPLSQFCNRQQRHLHLSGPRQASQVPRLERLSQFCSQFRHRRPLHQPLRIQRPRRAPRSPFFRQPGTKLPSHRTPRRKRQIPNRPPRIPCRLLPSER